MLENWVPTTLSASNLDELQTIENTIWLYLGYLDNLPFVRSNNSAVLQIKNLGIH